ncbi:asparaginase [Actinokineospora sp. NPDC004072]
MPDAQPASRRVVVFGLGGTIAMTSDDTGGVVPALSAEQLVAAVPGLAAASVTVDVVDFRRKPGASLSFHDLADLTDTIAARLDRGDVDGVVITQGTDTIEETAYLLDLLHHRPQPLVVTGAMRNPTLAGADGPANILAAVRTAASPELRGQGCVVVLADEIHAARRVRKTHSTSGATFQSLNGGPLGVVLEGRPRLHNRLSHRTVIPTEPRLPGMRVGLATIALGDDGTLIDAAANRLDGLVVAAFGVGHVPTDLVPLLAKIAERIPVVLASRTGAGSTLRSTYAFTGSESDLIAHGLIGAGFLDPLKSRILLHTLLTVGADRATITTAFDAAGGHAHSNTWPWTAEADNQEP